MPKVLRIINRFNIGGPTYNAAYLTKYLPEEYETLLIGGDKEESEDSSQHILGELGITPLIIPEMKRAIRFGNDYAAYKKIKQIPLTAREKNCGSSANGQRCLDCVWK